MVMRGRKRGQGGGGAAALVAIITILIVLYIVFLPYEDRKDLLDDIDDNGDGGSSVVDDDVEYEINLLEAHPGRMDYRALDQIEHDLPSFTLKSITEGTVLEEVDNLFVKRAVFTDKDAVFEFTVEDYQNTENLLLNFAVMDGRGRLSISVNDKEFYNSEFEEGNIEPIELKKRHLREGSNVLEFSVSSPGVAFWRVNQYTLENVMVTADVTNVEGQKSSMSFIIDDEETKYIKEVRLKFMPDCRTGDVGPLTVNLNGMSVFSGVPDCGMYVSHEFLPSYIKTGENELEFISARGSYFVDQVMVKTELKEERAFVYDFTLNETLYDDVRRNRADVNFTVYMVDDGEYKELEVYVNRETGPRHISTRSPVDSLNINDYMREGYNYIRLAPKTDLYVTTATIDVIND